MRNIKNPMPFRFSNEIFVRRKVSILNESAGVVSFKTFAIVSVHMSLRGKISNDNRLFLTKIEFMLRMESNGWA